MKDKDINECLGLIRLKFNIEYPTDEACYQFGYECSQASLPEDENPFPAFSREAEQWVEGWWAGFYQEEPLFKDEVMVPSSASKTAMNDADYHPTSKMSFLSKVLKITGVIAATAIVGYQVIDLVA